MAIENSNNVIIRNNIIVHSYNPENGGGIFTIWSRAIIDKNIICNNSSDAGGAIFSHTCTNIITGNLTVNNIATGIGACYLYASSPVFYNNTVCNNSCLFGTGIQFSLFSDADLKQEYSNLFQQMKT